MRKFINILVFSTAIILFAGYMQNKNPDNIDKLVPSIYMNIKSEAAKLYEIGSEAVKNILMPNKVSETTAEAPKDVQNSGADIKNTINNFTKKIQSGSSMPDYKHTVNNSEEYSKVIYNALNSFEGSVSIRLNNYREAYYNLDTVNKVINDHFDLDYGIKSIKGTLYTSGSLHIITITFEYSFSRESMLSMRAASEAKAKQIIAEVIKPNMSDLQKELAIHDYIVKNTSYDYTNLAAGTLPGETYTIYGILINKMAVCEGYAKAMFKLLKMAGVENMVVIGEADGTPHAWNLVKINGSFTHLDATWDDPVTRTNIGILSHKYFNISDEKISKDHKWDTSKYPKAVSIPLK